MSTSIVQPASSRKPRGRLRRCLTRLGQALFSLGIVFAVVTAVIANRYGVAATEAAASLVKQMSSGAIRLGVAAYDPCTPKVARIAPDGDDQIGSEFVPVDSVLPVGRSFQTPAGTRIAAQEVRVERIVRSRFAFGYQPFDEPRLHELRTKYGLDRIVAAATDEFDALVRLRSWARGRFRRHDSQPAAINFDALEVLDRDLHTDEQLPTGGHYDPCTFFPLLYSQVVLSVGHQARLLSAEHGWVEVWSNLHRKWVTMDAELNHHFERAGVPLSTLDLLEASHGSSPSQVELVRGVSQPGTENPTMAHLKLERLTVPDTLWWFDDHIALVDLRNDWMTNHYFRGHPARSERCSLIYLNPWRAEPPQLKHRLRPQTNSKDDFNWTLNQVEILMRPDLGDALHLAFRTVTPNFDYYELTVDGGPPTRSSDPVHTWLLHQGTNTLSVRSVNKFGVRGIESFMKLLVVSR